MNTHFLTALILAGGQSSRMGRDKATIAIAGIPLLLRVCRAAAGCCDRAYILTPWPERYRDIVKGEYPFLLETHPGEGPLVALADGLTRIDTDWLLLLACDLPQLRSDILRRWTSRLEEVPRSRLAVVPRSGSRWEPLCGFYRREALESLQESIKTGGRSLQRWLSRVEAEPLAVGEAEAEMLFNCNRPEDLGAIGSASPKSDISGTIEGDR
jgi:molybdopterin-guanine dinucleotide biosynthesis protein A